MTNETCQYKNSPEKMEKRLPKMIESGIIGKSGD